MTLNPNIERKDILATYSSIKESLPQSSINTYKELTCNVYVFRFESFKYMLHISMQKLTLEEDIFCKSVPTYYH